MALHEVPPGMLGTTSFVRSSPGRRFQAASVTGRANRVRAITPWRSALLPLIGAVLVTVVRILGEQYLGWQG
jgi:hypothetical protein